MENNNNKQTLINNLLVDLIIKSSRVQTLINMLIDLNNGPASFEMEVESEKYEKLQNNLKSVVEVLAELVLRESDKLKNSVVDGEAK